MVGVELGKFVGAMVGEQDGMLIVGTLEGKELGLVVTGCVEGELEGHEMDGFWEGPTDGANEGFVDGKLVGSDVGISVITQDP